MGLDYGQDRLPPARVEIEDVVSIELRAQKQGVHQDLSLRLSPLRRVPEYLCSAFTGVEPDLTVIMRFAVRIEDPLAGVLHRQFGEIISGVPTLMFETTTRKVRIVEEAR